MSGTARRLPNRAWPDPTADAIFSALLLQTARLQPAPVFFANLGDFAGPGTIERHRHYLGLVESLPLPDLCVVGNHDLDDPSGSDAWSQIHGPRNFQFGYGHTRFVVIDAAPREIAAPANGGRGSTEGPGDEALAFLARSLESASEPHRVVLMHCPPHLNGRFAPHPEWGFDIREGEFLSLIRAHRVKLVCCAHALLFDHHVHDGTHFVVGWRWDGALLALPRCLHAGRRPTRRPRSTLPRRPDHRDRKGRNLRSSTAGLRSDRRKRPLHLRRSARRLSHRPPTRRRARPSRRIASET